MKRILYKFLMLTFLLSVISPMAQAQDADTRYTEVHVHAEKLRITSNEEITIATEIKLAPHWHVYWRNPGDSGLPVRIEWDLPEGFEISDIEWPTPEKITYDILANYGYYDRVVLLQTLKVPNVLPAADFTISANIDMLVCENICIPESDSDSITFNGADTQNTNAISLITDAKTKMPQNLNGDIVFAENENKELLLSITPKNSKLPQGLDTTKIEFFPYDWGVLQHVSTPKVTLSDDKILISHVRGDEDISNTEKLNGLLILGDKGYEISALKGDVQIAETVPVEAGEESSVTWFSALYLALFGGLILNLMPCVFPVLSMKALSLVKMGEKEKKHAQMHGIAYTLGVVLSFIAIGGALIALKEAGSAIGWGFQLQNPMVVAALAYLLFAIGMNLIGFFEFDFGLGNVGNKLTKGQSYSSSFFTGTLATIVATPCTAPFMGAAMGFAIAQPPYISISVFAMLGFGLALPYLILSFIPKSRSLLPRPGAWMVRFKQFLAFPMLASSIWLIWVLDQQSGSLGILLTLLGMLSIAFAIWLSHLKPEGMTKMLVRILFFICLIIPIVNLAYVTKMPQNSEILENIDQFGEKFSKKSLSEALKSKNPVFVELTAAWCITCKVNHATSINVQSTKDTFKKNNVTFLIGDWTNQDYEITEYLGEFNASGVPLYIFYGAPDQATGKRPKPVKLPQILSPSIVKNTVEGTQ